VLKVTVALQDELRRPGRERTEWHVDELTLHPLTPGYKKRIYIYKKIYICI